MYYSALMYKLFVAKPNFTDLGAFSPLPQTCQREFGGGLLVHSEFLKHNLIHLHTQDTFTY